MEYFNYITMASQSADAHIVELCPSRLQFSRAAQNVNWTKHGFLKVIAYDLWVPSLTVFIENMDKNMQFHLDFN